MEAEGLVSAPALHQHQRVSKATSSIFHGLTTGEFAKSDADNVRRVLPFQNVMGIAQLYSTMVSDLPEWRRRD